MLGRHEAGAFTDAREQMVEQQLRARGVADERVLDAMRELPRHDFVPPRVRQFAYDDSPLPIGNGQTISQPLMVATMLEALQLKGHERVLDVGTGSAYQAALLSRLAREVISIEIVPALARTADSLLRRLGKTNVRVVLGDGSLGWPAQAPYHAIVVAAGAPRVPAALVDQLDDDEGRLVIPVGDPLDQQLLRVHKRHRVLTTERLVWCEFVPLRGRAGWPKDAAAVA
jgi:protein-L-isoaspartate(D-aspartate) O-methyltransferase